jgi:hypothetical protein
MPMSDLTPARLLAMQELATRFGELARESINAALEDRPQGDDVEFDDVAYALAVEACALLAAYTTLRSRLVALEQELRADAEDAKTRGYGEASSMGHVCANRLAALLAADAPREEE